MVIVSLPINEILKLDLLNKASIKTGAHSIGTKVVEWVSVTEHPVENFVRENEFVLSTGIGCYGDTDELLKFVKDVYNSGASALAIATGRHIFTLPEETIRYAKEKDFVIIDIPWEIRFADIAHEIMSKLVELKKEEANRSKDIQQHLVQMVLEGKTLDVMTRFVERKLKSSVLICDERGDGIAGSANSEEVYIMWDELTKNQTSEQSYPFHGELMKLNKGDKQLLHLVIKSNGSHKGDFFILSNVNKIFTEEEVMIAEQAVVAVALWFSRDSAVLEAESRMRNEFLLNLATGEKMSKEHVDSHAVFFRYNLALPYVCIVGFPENLEGLIQAQQNKLVNKKTSLEQMNTYVKEGMYYAAHHIQRKILYACKNDEVIVYLETSTLTASDTVNQFLDLVERRFSHLLPSVTFSWGIGKYEEGIWHFEKSFNKAKAALDMGRNQRGIGQRTHFNETQINRLLLNLAQNEEVRNITMATVLPIVEYDEKSKMDLVNTFTIYKNNGGNVSQTARDLNLHRQSLIYRLRKIETLTALSLVNPEDLFLLDFSIKIWSTGLLK